jgi:hypothetical protein
MSKPEWDAIVVRMRAYWPASAFSQEVQALWYERLAAFSGQQVASAIDALLHEGSPFMPSLGQLIRALRADPSRPTFVEAFQLIYGRDGVVRASATPRGSSTFTTPQEEMDAKEQRLRGVHPLVRSFVQRQGIRRLEGLPLDDSEWGEKHCRDLEAAWDRHVEACDGREIAVMASGGESNGGLHRFDPRAGLPPNPRHLPKPSQEESQ